MRGGVAHRITFILGVRFREGENQPDKHVKLSFKPNKIIYTSKSLKLFRMDLCVPIRVLSRGEKVCFC